VPVAVVGSQVAHGVTNTLVGAPGDGSAELLQARGADFVPLLAGLALAVLAAGLAGRIAGTWSGGRPAAVRLPFALLAPALFVVQEHVETALRTGAPPFGTVLEHTFIPGLLLQVPFALAGYAMARALIRLADGVRGLVAAHRSTPRPARARQRRWPAYAGPRLSDAHDWAHSGRAPPPTVSAAA
jgi:hypothetical protein